MTQPWVYMCASSWTPPPTSLPIQTLRVVPVHPLWVPCFMHWTWTGDLFHIWYLAVILTVLDQVYTFVKGIRFMSKFIWFWHESFQCFNHHFLKRQFLFLHLYCCCSILKDQWTRFMLFYSGLSVPLIYLSLLSPIPHWLNDYSFTVSFETGLCQPPNSFSFDIVLAILCHLLTVYF